MNTIDELKPCPFCNSLNFVDYIGTGRHFQHERTNCVMRGMVLTLNEWNTSHTEPLKSEKTTDAGEDENTHRTLIHTQDDLKLSQQQCREQGAEIDNLKQELSKMKMDTVRASKTQPERKPK